MIGWGLCSRLGDDGAGAGPGAGASTGAGAGAGGDGVIGAKGTKDRIASWSILSGTKIASS